MNNRARVNSLRSHTPDSSEGDHDDNLPLSVRGAPPELRRIIRKRQNSESAKRCRERKKIESARTADEIVAQANKVRRLELVVGHLARKLEETHAIVAALVGASSSGPMRTAPLCRNGQPGCGGATCALCVRAMQANVPGDAFGGKIPGPNHAGWTQVSNSTANDGADGGRRGLPEAAGQGPDVGDEIEGRSWQ